MNDQGYVEDLEKQLIEKIAVCLVERRCEYKSVKVLCAALDIPTNEYALFVKRKPRKWALPRLIRLAYRLNIRVGLCYDEVSNGSPLQLVLSFDY